jgi:hypothetical protein
MTEFLNQLSNRFKAVYLFWIIFNFFVFLILGKGITEGKYFLIRDSYFFPFDFHFFDFNSYDYTEFLVYTLVPIFLYYIHWFWNKK